MRTACFTTRSADLNHHCNLDVLWPLSFGNLEIVDIFELTTYLVFSPGIRRWMRHSHCLKVLLPILEGGADTWVNMSHRGYTGCSWDTKDVSETLYPEVRWSSPGRHVMRPNTTCIHTFSEMLSRIPNFCHWFLWVVEFWIRFIFFFIYLYFTVQIMKYVLKGAYISQSQKLFMKADIKARLS